ncbi:hypothetical protein Tco_0088037 [Tanacetum coccineum]
MSAHNARDIFCKNSQYAHKHKKRHQTNFLSPIMHLLSNINGPKIGRAQRLTIDLLMEREARLSREAWGRSMDTSDTAHSEVRALRTTVLAQQIEIATLRAADRARQA